MNIEIYISYLIKKVHLTLFLVYITIFKLSTNAARKEMLKIIKQLILNV